MADAPDTLRDLRKHLKRALAVLDERAPGYVEARDYYDGTRAEVTANRALRRIINRNSQAYPTSIAHIPVDVLCDKVEFSALTASEAPAAAILTTVADENNLEEEIDDWVKKAGYFGDYYAIVDPTLEDANGSVTVDGIKWLGSSPLTTVVVYDERDDRTPLYGVKAWRKGKDEYANLYYDDCTVKLIAVNVSEGRDVERYDFDFDAAAGEEPGDAFLFHDGERMLISHLPIGSKPYGTPLHKRAWGPQDAITKISAVNLSNVEGQGFASRWALLDPLREINDDMENDFGDDGPTTASADSDGLTTATTERNARTVPGEIKLLRGVKEVGEFGTTATENFIKNQDWYMRFAAVSCGIAFFEFDMSGVQPSGESRRRAEGRSIKTADKIKRNVGSFLKRLGDITLGVLGTSGTVSATFYPSEMATDKEGLELVALKIKTGVPVDQALREAGYTEEQVLEWFPKGAAHMTPVLLIDLATAMQSLGQAKTLGVLTDAMVDAMLPESIVAAREGRPVPGARPVAPAGIVQPAPVDLDDEDDEPIDSELANAQARKVNAEAAKAEGDAVGAFVRAGAEGEEAARYVGVEGVTFPNKPTTVRVPEEEAAGLEGSVSAPPAPGA